MVLILASLASVGLSLPACHVDAFTGMPYRGNPACVVLLKQAAEETWMQNVANEMQLSETAFLVRRAKDDAFDLRWFTPTAEVDLCGHATLASSHALWDVHGCDPASPLYFHTRSGILKASRESSGWINLDVRSRCSFGGFPCRVSPRINPLLVSTHFSSAVPYLRSGSGAKHLPRLARRVDRLSQPRAEGHSIHRA